MTTASLDLTAEINRKVDLMLRLAKSVEDEVLVDQFLVEILEPLDPALRLEVEGQFGQEWYRYESARNLQRQASAGGWSLD